MFLPQVQVFREFQTGVNKLFYLLVDFRYHAGEGKAIRVVNIVRYVCVPRKAGEYRVVLFLVINLFNVSKTNPQNFYLK